MQQAFSPEAKEEALAITDLATNLSDGMQVMRAQNFTKPFATFQEIREVPTLLGDARSYTEEFVAWQSDRQKRKVHRLQWASPEVFEDAFLYVRRRIWARKMADQLIILPQARMLSAFIHLHKAYRNDVHEALNHAVKHNEELSAAKLEMVELLDEVVLKHLKSATEMLAGEMLATLPELQQALLEDMNRE